jgi:hypothetical protein
MLATFAASRDRAGPPVLVGMLDGASGTPIGESEGACGGGSAAPGDPVTFCALSPVGGGALGTFEGGSAALAVGVFGVAAVGVCVLGALVGALGVLPPLGAESLDAALGLPLGALGALLDAPAT